jgi:3'(2'), 5'-bisphosphate nucleotidase
MNTPRDAELEEVLRIAREASAVIRAIYEAGFSVELKGPDDPVTRADREANDLICAALARAFPGDAILAEESVPTDKAEIARLAAQPRVWFVDPLDGTKEFTERIDGEFAVMIGLAEAGRATLGVVVMPSTNVALLGRVEGARGHVALLERASGEREPLAVTSQADPRAAGMMVSRSHRPKVADLVAEKLGVTRMIPCGSVGVKVARVVTAEADVYVHGGGGPKSWGAGELAAWYPRARRVLRGVRRR